MRRRFLALTMLGAALFGMAAISGMMETAANDKDSADGEGGKTDKGGKADKDSKGGKGSEDDATDKDNVDGAAGKKTKSGKGRKSRRADKDSEDGTTGTAEKDAKSGKGRKDSANGTAEKGVRTAESSKGSAADPASAATVLSESDAPDYSRQECWLKFPEITRDVDAFYIYSTTYIESSYEEGAPDYAPLDNPEMVAGAQDEYVTNASVFEDSANVFVPYYRQAGIRFAGEIAARTGDIDAALSGVSCDDITAALDYYFDNYNNGRPFIIAGHSQGSAMVRYLLKNYFKKHPDYYERMVAAYAIGYSITRDDLAAYPYLKFAAGESDTGVIISWNTEGRQNVEENAHNAVVLPDAISINPLNWRLDDTYAPASENLGSLVPNMELMKYEIGDIGADAQIVPGRGVVLTNANGEPAPLTDFFGPQSFHEDDYTLYYNNIKDNVAKRVAAYLASR